MAEEFDKPFSWADLQLAPTYGEVDDAGVEVGKLLPHFRLNVPQFFVNPSQSLSHTSPTLRTLKFETRHSSAGRWAVTVVTRPGLDPCPQAKETRCGGATLSRRTVKSISNLSAWAPVA